MKIAMGSDHGGIHLKNHLKDYLELKGYEVIDKGTYTEESCDYPDYAAMPLPAVKPIWAYLCAAPGLVFP